MNEPIGHMNFRQTNYIEVQRDALVKIERFLNKTGDFADLVMLRDMLVGIIENLTSMMNKFSSYPEATTFEFLRDQAADLLSQCEKQMEDYKARVLAQRTVTSQRKARTR